MENTPGLQLSYLSFSFLLLLQPSLPTSPASLRRSPLRIWSSKPQTLAAAGAPRGRSSHERLSLPRGHDPPLLGPRPPPQDLRQQVLLR